MSAKFPDGELPPLDNIEAWIDESCRAQAPKKLIAQLDGRAPSAVAKSPVAKAAPKKAAAKKAPAKKAAARKVPAKKVTAKK